MAELQAPIADGPQNLEGQASRAELHGVRADGPHGTWTDSQMNMRDGGQSRHE